MNFINLNTGAASSVSTISAISASGVITDGTSLFEPSFTASSETKSVLLQISEFLGHEAAGVETSEKSVAHIVVSAIGIKSATLIITTASGTTKTYSKNCNNCNEVVIHLDRMVLSRYFDVSIMVNAADISGLSMHAVYSKRTVRR